MHYVPLLQDFSVLLSLYWKRIHMLNPLKMNPILELGINYQIKSSI